MTAGADAAPVGPLRGLLAIDLTDGALGAYAGLLLTTLGVDVVKVESPAGDSLRRDRPFLDGQAGAQRSLRWLRFGVGRRSVALDLEAPTDVTIVQRLIAGADIVLENRPVGYLHERDLGYEDLAAANPQLIMCSVTPFGQSGPRRHWRGSDIVGYATGGLMSQTGEADGPPVRLGGHAAEHLAGMYAALGTLVALTRRTMTGRGDHVDVSMQEAVAATFIDAGATYYSFNNKLNPTRIGSEHAIVVPVTQAPCVDGSVVLAAPMPHQFHALLDWMRDQGADVEVLEDPVYDSPVNRGALRDLIHFTVHEATAHRAKLEIYDELQARGIPCAPVSSTADLAGSVQLAARSWFEPITLPDGRASHLQGPPFRMSLTPTRPPTPAPAIGEHDCELREQAASPPRARAEEAGHVIRRGRPWGPPRALTGLRVLDLTIALAGPWAGRLLATEGAEVIRVETAKRVDTLRRFAADPERSGSFINSNAGKLGITLDVATDEGRELARRLAGECDVVLENFRPGVLDRLGLSWDVLHELNPELIMCSMPAQGESGPHRTYIAYAPALTALSGYTYLTGLPESPPCGLGVGFIDLLSGAHADLAVLAALHHRDRTGNGQYIELSQTEAAISMLDSSILEYFANGVVAERLGNRDLNQAPHGCYRCAGEDRWIVIAVKDDDEWQRLTAVIDRPDLLSDRELSTVEGRLARHDELDGAVAAWTTDRDPHEAMRTLQEAGVPAGVVQTVGDLLELDEHLRERRYFEEVEHPVMGTVELDRAPFTLLSTPGTLDGRAAPLMGQHDDDVYSQILGLTAAEIASLRQSGVIDAHLLAPM